MQSAPSPSPVTMLDNGAGTPPALDDPGLYINRELSFLQFNRRVLALAGLPEVPLLERLRYLTISSTNLDEFFEVRVAGLKQKEAYGVTRAGPDGLSVDEQLSRISTAGHALVDEQYRVLNDELLPALDDEGITIIKRNLWTAGQRTWVRRYFQKQVLPVLSPVGLDPSHPFPRLLNKNLNFIVSMQGKDAFGRNSGIAIVQVPRCLPRLIALPEEESPQPFTFVLLSSVVHAHIGDIFPGMRIKGCHQFRITRNSDLWVDPEEVDDLLHALKGELPSRRYGDAVRLEVADNCPSEQSAFLLHRFGLSDDDLYRVNGPVNLHRMAALIDRVDRPDLKFTPFMPRTPKPLGKGALILEEMARRDILLHHPFENFSPVIELVRQAAADPDVLAIKQTLYRTSDDSPLVNALVEAARRGKEVTVVVELRARFDEAANIEKATRLQEAGANVVYGVVGYKTHAKMLLIVRREGRKLRRYVHLGTGNYHDGTARIYTDFGHLTSDKAVGRDVHRLFLSLTGMGDIPRLDRLLDSPFRMYDRVLAMIAREQAAAERGEEAWIDARMNSLSEETVIQALYEASQAGVRIRLLVRGICRLRPGVSGVSENIEVRSVIGRFLEHSRVWAFHAGGEQEAFCASADWMFRNLHRRVEVAWPITDAKMRTRLRREAIDGYFEDNSQAWELQPDGSYIHCRPPEGGVRVAWQERLMEGVGGGST